MTRTILIFRFVNCLWLNMYNSFDVYLRSNDYSFIFNDRTFAFVKHLPAPIIGDFLTGDLYAEWRHNMVSGRFLKKNRGKIPGIDVLPEEAKRPR